MFATGHTYIYIYTHISVKEKKHDRFSSFVSSVRVEFLHFILRMAHQLQGTSTVCSAAAEIQEGGIPKHPLESARCGKVEGRAQHGTYFLLFRQL